MTINIALATTDALVLGCDSVASTSNYFIDPMRIAWELDANGTPIKDSNGKYTLKFDYGDYESIVTNAWGGVTKMFEIHPHPSPIVAVTSGLAKLNDRPIADYGREFIAQSVGKDWSSSAEISQEFLNFMRGKYEEHYKDSKLPPPLQEGPVFLVGGYGVDEDFPSIYRIAVQHNAIFKQPPDSHAGLVWSGQSDAVERFIRGYDGDLRTELEERTKIEFQSYFEQAAKHFTEFVNDLLKKTGQNLPEGLKPEPPPPPSIAFDWTKYETGIDFANIPLQDAVNFVSFLVMLQAGKSRFARGIATVGGRIHVGVVKKEGFTLLNEPELAHRITGFGDDL